MRMLDRLRGALCVALLPFHTALFALVGIVVAVARPRGHGVLRVARAWARTVLASGGVRVRGIGADRTPAGPCVVIVNHQSLFDIPSLVVVLPGPFRMVAKRELFRIPVFGWALSAGGFIPVDRGNRERAIASLERAADRLRDGSAIVMFAEGTRSPDGRLRPLKKGPFRLAQRMEVPVLPVTLSGTRAILAREGWLPRPGPVDVVVGSPLPPARPDQPIELHVQRAAAALEAGYTERHAADLEPWRRRRP